jgi:predicted dehydrogenase
MSDPIRVAVIGLDTSHAVEFTKLIKEPECEAFAEFQNLNVVSCLRFSTPFQSEEGLDERETQMKAWGVKVTRDFSEAVAGCDAIMLEINDPAYHLEYFEKCVGLGKPIFLDKPMADTAANGRKIYDLTKKHKARVYSASSLRHTGALAAAKGELPEVEYATIYGALGTAPSGSSVVWYGVHAFEMLEFAMGRGAVSVRACAEDAGVVAVVEYPGGRRGVVELVTGSYLYGGTLRTNQKAVSYCVDAGRLYADQVRVIGAFFSGEDSECTMDDTLEVMKMLDAAQRSVDSGKVEKVN